MQSIKRLNEIIFNFLFWNSPHKKHLILRSHNLPNYQVKHNRRKTTAILRTDPKLEVYQYQFCIDDCYSNIHGVKLNKTLTFLV